MDALMSKFLSIFLPSFHGVGKVASHSYLMKIIGL
jgi:hypothetical protein